MSAQTRYRTLVHNISRVYSSQDAGRTELLQTGIDEIVTVVSPGSPMQWRTVKSDTERLLRVWSAKEGDSDVARVVAGEIAGLLDDLSTVAPAPAPAPDRIAHVMPYPSLVVVDAPAPAPAPPIILSSPVVFTVTKEDGDDVVSLSSEEAEEEEVAEEEAEEEVAAASESEAEEEEEEEEEHEAEAEEEEEEEPEAEEEVAEEEEVVEPEEEPEAAEEEEEAGMEVEQVMIRGRTYWKDTNTNKLYAVIRGEDGEDDVGDEVGVLENGKPRFLAK
jgi:hypothetical protein